MPTYRFKTEARGGGPRRVYSARDSVEGPRSAVLEVPVVPTGVWVLRQACSLLTGYAMMWTMCSRYFVILVLFQGAWFFSIPSSSCSTLLSPSCLPSSRLIFQTLQTWTRICSIYQKRYYSPFYSYHIVKECLHFPLPAAVFCLALYRPGQGLSSVTLKAVALSSPDLNKSDTWWQVSSITSFIMPK